MYTVTLKKVTDSKGCSQDLDSDEQTVRFRNAHVILGFLEGRNVGISSQLLEIHVGKLLKFIMKMWIMLKKFMIWPIQILIVMNYRSQSFLLSWERYP